MDSTNPLPRWTPSMPELTEDDLGSPGVLVVHYWADWDLHDREMDHRLARVRGDYATNIRFRSCDFDRAENQPYLQDVLNIPALGFYLSGRRRALLIGLRQEAELHAVFSSWIAEAGVEEEQQPANPAGPPWFVRRLLGRTVKR